MINIYSDLLLEPFLKNKKLKFYYNETYGKISVKNEVFVFIFCDYFKAYTLDNYKKIIETVKHISTHNKVYLLGDIFNFDIPNYLNVTTVNSHLDSIDFDLTLGSYSQMPLKKSGQNKLNFLLTRYINLKIKVFESNIC